MGLRNRLLSYEIHVCTEGRWTLDAILKGEEAAAVAAARGRLASGQFAEVKLVRVRAMLTGFATRKEILHELRPLQKDKPLVVTGRVDERAAGCVELADLYAPASRQLMGRLFRMFLDRFQVTPTELLHNWSYTRKLADTGTLVSSALFQVASAQAQAQGTGVRERMAALQPLVDRALARSRDFAAERRRLPRFESEDLNRLGRRLRDAVPAEDYDFTVLALLCRHLTATGSLGGKLEMTLALIRPDLDPDLVRLFEGVIADALGGAEMVKDLMGPQPSLGASLTALAHFLNGRAEHAAVSPTLARIGALIGEGVAPCCRGVLLDRLLAELGRDGNPLDRKHPEADGPLVDAIVAALRDADGELLGGAVAEKAIARRRLRLRQAMLRRLGLEDQAAALGAELKALAT